MTETEYRSIPNTVEASSMYARKLMYNIKRRDRYYQSLSEMAEGSNVWKDYY